MPLSWSVILPDVAPLAGAVLGMLFGVIALKWFFRSPIAEAIAERIRTRRRGFGDATLQGTVAQDVARLQGEVAELAEWLDFAERLLAESRHRPAAPAVPPPGSGS